MSVKGIHREGINLFFENNLFLTNGCNLLNIQFRWGIQLFWVAFDMHVTVVPLKVALGWDKVDFWAFQINNHGPPLDIHLF